MRILPVYAIELLTITLTRAEADKALTHPKPLQDLIATVLQNGKAGVEHVAEEALAEGFAPEAKAAKPSKRQKTVKRKPIGDGVEHTCPVCGQHLRTAGFLVRHTKAKHGETYNLAN